MAMSLRSAPPLEPLFASTPTTWNRLDPKLIWVPMGLVPVS